MAIDNATKRASVLNFAAGDLLPVPNNDIDQGDRQTLANLYSGIAADNPTVVVSTAARKQNRRTHTTGFA